MVFRGQFPICGSPSALLKDFPFLTVAFDCSRRHAHLVRGNLDCGKTSRRRSTEVTCALFKLRVRATTSVVLENNLRITRSGECVFDAFVKHYVNKMEKMDHNIHGYSSNNQVTHGAGHSFSCRMCLVPTFVVCHLPLLQPHGRCEFHA